MLPVGIPLNIKQQLLSVVKRVATTSGNDLSSQASKLKLKLEDLKRDEELLIKVVEYQSTLHYNNEFKQDLELLRQLNKLLDSI